MTETLYVAILGCKCNKYVTNVTTSLEKVNVMHLKKAGKWLIVMAALTVMTGIKAEAVTMTAGADLVSAVVISEDDIDIEDDSDEDTSGQSFGYTNLGVADVEDHLNIRATEDDSSKIVGKMSQNAGCEVLEITGDKAHITSGSVEGYVSLDYLLT